MPRTLYLRRNDSCELNRNLRLHKTFSDIPSRNRLNIVNLPCIVLQVLILVSSEVRLGLGIGRDYGQPGNNGRRLLKIMQPAACRIGAKVPWFARTCAAAARRERNKWWSEPPEKTRFIFQFGSSWWMQGVSVYENVCQVAGNLYVLYIIKYCIYCTVYIPSCCKLPDDTQQDFLWTIFNVQRPAS